MKVKMRVRFAVKLLCTYFHLEVKRRHKNKRYVHELGDLVSQKSSAKKKTGLSWDMLVRLHLNSVFG